MNKTPQKLSTSIVTVLALCASVFFVSITATQASETCRGDIGTCTPAELCDASTALLDGKTVWSTDPNYAGHVATAQQVGLDCGVVEVITPTCETDAELCTIAALCAQATKELTDSSSIVWSNEKAEHVTLAQEYGLECGVTASADQVEVVEIPANADELSDLTVCGLAAMSHTDATMWNAIAESRSLTCGENETREQTLRNYVAQLSDTVLCELLDSDPQNENAYTWRTEAAARDLTCDAPISVTGQTPSTPNKSDICNQATESNGDIVVWRRDIPALREVVAQNVTCYISPINACPDAGYFHGCYGTETAPNGDKLIGFWHHDQLGGVGTIIQENGNVMVGMTNRQSIMNGGIGVYIFREGGWVHFEWQWDWAQNYSANSTVNDVFPFLTRSFQNLPRNHRISIQNSLARKGLYDSAIDGLWGRNTLIGIVRFTGEYLDTVNLKSFENVEIVLSAIADQIDLDRTERAPVSLLLASLERDQLFGQAVSADLTSSFQNQSMLRRQQVQYALRELGMYSSSIDGIWGDRTNEAIVSFVQANGLQTSDPNDVFRRILSMVDVPISFAAPRSNPPNRSPASNTRSPSNSYGLTAIVSNPSTPASQALAICRPQADLARRQAGSSSSSPNYGYSANCRQNGNLYNCDVNQNSGGFWGGFADGLGRSLSRRAAYESVLESCLAQHGWRQ